MNIENSFLVLSSQLGLLRKRKRAFLLLKKSLVFISLYVAPWYEMYPIKIRTDLTKVEARVIFGDHTKCY